ncbi:MAG: outer membrane protein assembly factor BamB [Sedimenticolaceae bacterium]
MKRYLISILVLLLTGCSSMNPLNWLGDEDNAEPPAELIELQGEIPVTTLWSTSVGEGADEQRVKLAPAVFEGRVYVANRQGAVKALDAATGRVVWGIETELEISGGPGVGDGLVLVGTSNAELLAFDAETGSEKWRTRVSSEVLSLPTAAQGTVVVHTIDGKIFGLDAGDGSQTWIYDRSIPVLTLHGSSSPIISGNTVICGFSSGKLAALDLTTGELLWEVSITAPSGRSELERMVDIDGDPLIREGVIYVSTYQGDIAAVSEDTGVVLWRRKLSSYTGLGADWRQLYITDADDYVWAIDPGNGSALWKNKKMHARMLSAPAVLGEYILVGDFEGYLHWLAQEDGRLLGRIRVGDAPITTTPLVVDGIAYIYGDGGEMAAITVAAIN